MERENIDKAFLGRWRMLVENTQSPMMNIVEVKEMCRDFFEAGILLVEGVTISCIECDDTVVESFDIWWNLYDKKRERMNCLKKWKNLTSKERLDCYNYTPAYVRATPDKQYRKDPITFLRNKCWHDEIIFSPSKGHPTDHQLVNDTANRIRTLEAERRNSN